MSDAANNSGQRDRSPAYPSIPLGTALERLVQFETHFKRSQARPEKIGDAWGVKGKAYVDRIAAALRYFGLLEYQGAGKDRYVNVSEEGRKYLRAQQEETKREVIRSVALRPKSISKFWGHWGTDRPSDAACLDELVFKNGFSEVGARDFLKVYDATISYAKLSSSDKTQANDGPGDDESSEIVDDPLPQGETTTRIVPAVGSTQRTGGRLMPDERELTTGLLARDASFRLIVTGKIGAKEIDRLIAKLQLDKEILAEQDVDEEVNQRDNL